MSSPDIRFIRRLGDAHITACAALQECPDILELADGNFAVIGEDITAKAKAKLPAGSGCGATERVVVIPRALLVRAKSDIPNA